MAKLTKDFFTGNEVLFVGYSGNASKNRVFAKGVYESFVNNGIKVYPLNSKTGGSYDIKVYTGMAELPKIPQNAYILTSSGNTAKIVKELIDSGVKKILFQSKKTVTPELLEQCGKAGVEAAVACPMMIFGSGYHKIHAFFAGVRG